jgi:hypothetical protein
MTVILDTWEAEIRRILGPAQYRGKKFSRLHLNRKIAGYGGTPVIPATTRKL